MKLLSIFICGLILAGHSYASNCHLKDWFKLDAIVEKHNGSSANLNQKKPSERMIAYKRVKQNRLLGEYGSVWDSKYPITPHCITTSENKKFPQSYLAAFLQHLFPDDIGTIANQAHSSQLSHISNAGWGKLVRYILANKDSLDERKLTNIILGRTKRMKGYEEKRNKLDKFREHEFKLAWIRLALDKIKSSTPEWLKKNGVTDGKKIIQLSQLVHSDKSAAYFPDNKVPFIDGEVGKLYTFMKDYDDIKSLRRAGKKQTPKEKKSLAELLLTHKNTDAFKFAESHNIYDAISIADLIVKAYKNRGKGGAYENVIDDALMIFFWARVGSDDGVEQFYDKLLQLSTKKGDAKKELHDELCKKEYSKKRFLQLIKKYENQASRAELLGATSEDLGFIIWGKKIANSDFMPLLFYKKTTYRRDEDGKKFDYSSCVETSIHNFLNAVLYDGGTFNISALPLGKNVAELYTKFNQPMMHLGRKAYDYVAQNIASDHAKVQYCKPKNEQKKHFEIRSGLLSILRILNANLAKPSREVTKLIDIAAESKSPEDAYAAIEKTLSQFSSKNKPIEIDEDTPDSIEYNHALGDFTAVIEMEIGDREFVWDIKKGHSFIKSEGDSHIDFFSLEQVKQLLGKNSMAAAFADITSEEVVESILALPTDKALELLWGTAVTNFDNTATVIRLCLQSDDARINEFAYTVLKQVNEFVEDTHTLSIVVDMLVLGEKMLVDEAKLVKILNICPDLLNRNFFMSKKQILEFGLEKPLSKEPQEILEKKTVGGQEYVKFYVGLIEWIAKYRPSLLSEITSVPNDFCLNLRTCPGFVKPQIDWLKGKQLKKMSILNLAVSSDYFGKVYDEVMPNIANMKKLKELRLPRYAVKNGVPENIKLSDKQMDVLMDTVKQLPKLRLLNLNLESFSFKNYSDIVKIVPDTLLYLETKVMSVDEFCKIIELFPKDSDKLFNLSLAISHSTGYYNREPFMRNAKKVIKTFFEHFDYASANISGGLYKSQYKELFQYMDNMKWDKARISISHSGLYDDIRRST